MGGFPVRPFIENWLRSNTNRTVTLVEIHKELPQIQERSIQSVMRRLADEPESGVTVVHRGHAWRYDIHAVTPPEASEALARVEEELEAEPVTRTKTRPAKERPTEAARVEPDGGTPEPVFKWVGWSTSANPLQRRKPIVRGADGTLYRCEPI